MARNPIFKSMPKGKLTMPKPVSVKMPRAAKGSLVKGPALSSAGK